MPAKDATGKRLSGPMQQRAKRRRELGPPPDPYVGLRPAPRAGTLAGVRDCLSWANDVAALTLAAAAHPAADVERLKLVQDTVSKLGMLKDKAQRSVKVCKIRETFQGRMVDLLAEAPPVGDAVAAPAWAFLRLVGVLDEMCRAPFEQVAAARWKLTAQLAARLGYVADKHETRAIIDHAKQEAPRAAGAARGAA